MFLETRKRDLGHKLQREAKMGESSMGLAVIQQRVCDEGWANQNSKSSWRPLMHSGMNMFPSCSIIPSSRNSVGWLR